MRRLAEVSNRAQVLGLLGVVWVLIGVGYAIGARPDAGYYDEYAPDLLRAAVWVLPGAVAIGAARWRAHDDDAWALAIVPIAAGVAVRIATWLGHLVVGTKLPGGLWLSVLLYIVIGVFINRCAAGLDRPPRQLLEGSARGEA